MLTIKKVRECAKNSGKQLIFNRSTGEYQITHNFTSSFGEVSFRDEGGKLSLNQDQLKKLLSYI